MRPVSEGETDPTPAGPELWRVDTENDATGAGFEDQFEFLCFLRFVDLIFGGAIVVSLALVVPPSRCVDSPFVSSSPNTATAMAATSSSPFAFAAVDSRSRCLRRCQCSSS